MITHIVMWQLKDHAEGADKAQNLQKMKALLESCKELVPGILRLDVAMAQPGLEATCDIVMVSEFVSIEALDAYQSHPHHVAMKPFIGAIRQTRHCMDYQRE
jgi:riboflavin synthase